MRSEIRLVHTADSHIGYKQYHSEIRRQDFLNAFSSVINDSIEMNVDAVIHAGDLFDTRNPTLDDILDTIAILSKLKSADIPFLAIVGNHESKQNSQWLDLFENMGIAVRLGTEPYRIDGVSIYGIDNISRSKISSFDYSLFNAQEESDYNIIVMHQLMKPFSFGEWDCREVIDSLPFNVDAILLGDYHIHDKTMVGDAWVTYSGSTERNSASEKERRSYNIVKISDSGIDISRRHIPTREFAFIPVNISGVSDIYEDIFGKIDEHNLKDRVVFVDIHGETSVPVSYTDIEEHLRNRGALVSRVRDMRIAGNRPDNLSISVSFSDPDEAVKKEINRMHLTSAGLLIDEIVRDLNIPKSRVDAESEERIASMMETMDFKQMDFDNEQTYSDNLNAGSEQSEESTQVRKSLIESEVDMVTAQSDDEPETETSKEQSSGKVTDPDRPEQGRHSSLKQHNLGDFL